MAMVIQRLFCSDLVI